MAKNFKLKMPSIEFNSVIYQLGLGGIHSVDKPGIFKSENGYILLDADVTSFYPASIIEYDICPEHLDNAIFKQILVDALNDRKTYKKKKKENILYAALEYGLKIGLNSIFGLFGYANFLLFDLLATYKVTVNNQLFLLQLIEMINLAGYNVISANTDGIVLHIPQYDLNIVNFIFKCWEEQTGFSLEYAYYDLYVRRDVNNYVTRKTDGTVKIKGSFIPPGAFIEPYYNYDLPKAANGKYMPIKGILKGYKIPPIVAIALQKYYLSGIPVEKTIYNHTDIYDFCSSQKVGKQFTNVIQYVKRKLITTYKVTKKEVVRKKRTIPVFVYEDEYMDYSKSTRGKKIINRVVLADKVVLPEEYELVEREKTYSTPKLDDEILDETEVQKTVRFFVSVPATDEEGNLYGYSIKKYKVEDGEKKYTDYVSGQFVKLFNNYYDADTIFDYGIDYDYYISLCMREIEKIGVI